MITDYFYFGVIIRVENPEETPWVYFNEYGDIHALGERPPLEIFSNATDDLDDIYGWIGDESIYSEDLDTAFGSDAYVKEKHKCRFNESLMALSDLEVCYNPHSYSSNIWGGRYC